MEDVLQIALKLKELETCGELRVVYNNDIGSNALVMSNSENYVIVIDPALSWEQQVREIWHEAKHIYSHIGNTNVSTIIAESEADSFADRAYKTNILYELRKTM